MADESIFEQFMKENQIKEATEKMGIKDEFQQEITKNISQGITRAGFDNLNAKELLATIVKLKPSSAKGTYVKSVFMSSTMSPGVRIDEKSVK